MIVHITTRNAVTDVASSAVLKCHLVTFSFDEYSLKFSFFAVTSLIETEL